jgi:UDP-2,4-diacetamido-2,4,6-trideoxy-beta-L-altropyranose hydrolase
VGGGARGHLVTPRALLAADCGRGVGLGHLERMLALADALHPDVEVSVLVPEDDPALQQRVSDRGHLALVARGDTCDRVEAALGDSPSFDAVILDGYVFPIRLQRRVRDRAPLTVVDDLGLPADCELGVNPSPGGEALRPAGAAMFLGGADYALIRASVVHARALVLRRGGDRRSVLVSTGATDLARLGPDVTDALLDGDADVEVTRVIGPDSGDRRDARPREHLLVAPPDLASALAAASVYVGAAGTTAVQAACVGIPAVITAAVSNQESQAAALAAAGCAVVVDTAGMASACLTLLDDPERRAEMASSGRALVDGRGASRVAEAIRHLVVARAA